MKTFNIKKMRVLGATFFIGFMLVLTGCGSEKSLVSSGDPATSEVPPPSQPDGPYTPPGSSTGAEAEVVFDYGANAPIDLNGSTDAQKQQTLNSYVGVPRYNISNLSLNVNLVKRGQGFGGQIAIGYFDHDSNTQRTGVFKNGDDYVYPDTPMEEAAQYNVWFTKNGKLYFHGFFQDNQGGVILVIDELISEGDGAAPSLASGTIWFKNFQIYSDPWTIKPPHPPSHCWFVSIGPFDCQTWKDGNYGIDTTQSVLPTDGYQKLGRFQGLDLNIAFNGEDLGIH